RDPLIKSQARPRSQQVTRPPRPPTRHPPAPSTERTAEDRRGPPRVPNRVAADRARGGGSRAVAPPKPKAFFPVRQAHISIRGYSRRCLVNCREPSRNSHPRPRSQQPLRPPRPPTRHPPAPSTERTAEDRRGPPRVPNRVAADRARGGGSRAVAPPKPKAFFPVRQAHISIRGYSRRCLVNCREPSRNSHPRPRSQQPLRPPRPPTRHPPAPSTERTAEDRRGPPRVPNRVA